MKILIPILGFSKSGGKRVLCELANNWIQMGHSVAFLTHDSSIDPYFETCAQIYAYDNKGKLQEVSDNKLYIGSKKEYSVISKLIALTRALSSVRSEYDVILANHSLTALPIKVATLGVNKIHPYYIQAYEPEYYLKRGSGNKISSLVLFLLSWISYRLKFKQVVNSNIYMEYKGISAIGFIPPGIDFNKFYPKISYKDFSRSDEIILGCIGRPEPFKGTIYAIKAFEALNKIDNRFKLKLAYGGAPEDWCHADAQIVIPNNDVELGDYYRSIDIMIAPGTVQLGAPHYPVMEAMACATPVITTGYMPATQDNSWLVRIKSVDDIVSAAISIIDNKEYIVKVEAANKAIEPFSWKAVSSDFLKILER